MFGSPLQLFVLDVVSILLFLVIIVQSYYIYKLHHRLASQTQTLEQLKEIVYALYKSAKGSKAVNIDHFDLSK